MFSSCSNSDIKNSTAIMSRVVTKRVFQLIMTSTQPTVSGGAVNEWFQAQ